MEQIARVYESSSCSSESDEDTEWARGFPHVDGNWPSHVYINVQDSVEFQRHRQEAIDVLRQKYTGPLVIQDAEWHLSLSRPFVLRYEQIEPFVKELRHAVRWRRRFQCTLQHASILLNDQGTRSFLCLDSTNNEVNGIIQCVDRALSAFQQPVYYKNPKVHVSIASTLQDRLRRVIPENKRVDLISETSFPVINISCSIGNKTFDIELVE